MSKWEEALGHPVEFETWHNIWENVTKTPLCITLKENIYKIMMGIQTYWTMVRLWLQRVLLLDVQPDPLVFILGKRVPNLKNPMQKLVNALLTGARCAIVDFLERVRFIRRMEYLTALHNDTVDSFDRIWSAWDSTQIV
ncbi:hypothetical protein XELAEV_18035108mg [Xenopus laevis]|uniref:Uncharacterized protein n=1 Tax=Xenopus laevis TaxID=8355 RepID=A0A974CF59_XENLA|nr:hypothetical protein XELAEV_18035108mg [Xenopus laevis]